MKFIDFFAGIGGFRRGLEMAGHECVGFCEWDKYATASYTAMHLATPDQRAFIETLPKKERTKEILKSEYKNGEWYADDVRSVNGGNCPKADIFCFGAPCQDFSIAGVRCGVGGNRSSLVAEIFRIVGEQEDKPEWLIYENVVGMLSSNSGWDYFAIISEMDRLGYDVEWRIFNSKDYGVPQNRERVYTIGHFRKNGRCEVLPEIAPIGENSIPIIQIGQHDTKTRKNSNVLRVYDSDGLAPTIATMQGGNRQPCVLDRGRVRKLTPRECFRLQGWSDEYFDRAALINSDAQLYKQAGNGVTVNVVYEIGKRIAEIERRYS